MTRIAHILLCMLLIAHWASAQSQNHCVIRVDVVYARGGHAPAELRVQLVRGVNGTTVGVAYTNSLGTAEFGDLAPGQYQAVVSGEGIETASSGTIEVNDWNVFQSQIVAIRTTSRDNESKGPAKVRAEDLNISPKAVKEYNRGNEEMQRKHWDKAIERFNAAITLHPKFSAAYNNLAVCYGQSGQPDEQRKTLHKLLEVNDQFLPGLLNLCELEMRSRNFSEAGSLLEKALKIDPSNVDALAYLAQLDFAQGQYELAIAAVRKAHELPHHNFPGIHFTSASAYEHEGQIAEAIRELEVFLSEAPDSPRAESARKAIAGLKRQGK
jgi:tetratricopeptide (TPR) repeat protein